MTLQLSDIAKAKRHAVLERHCAQYALMCHADQQDILDGRCRFRISKEDGVTAILDYAQPRGPGVQIVVSKEEFDAAHP